MSKQVYFVTEVDSNERIDKLLAQLNNSYSRTEVQKWITNGFVFVNGNKIKPNYKCQVGDEILWSIQHKEQLEIEPEYIPLDIFYEDTFLFVVNKSRGMVIHPIVAHPTGTLVNALLFHTNKLLQIGGEERPGIVHRIDKNTSGLLLIAKDDVTHEALREQFITGECERTYEAIVHGVIDHETGIIEAPIARDPVIRTKMAVVTGGREAITHFRVLKRYDRFTHVQCQLKTGRTHQIRVHMNYIGHSVVGDPIYIDHKLDDIGGQALFSQGLKFIHPETKKYVQFEVKQPMYFQNILKELTGGGEN